MVGTRSLLLTAAIAAIVPTAQAAFYVPGVAPESWADGENLALNVNKITSTKTLVPYEYYYLPFCRPASIQEESENLGEIMSGDSIMDSLYVLQMQKNSRCQVLCKPMTYKPKDTEKFIDMIKDEYYVQWVVDNLPVLYRDPADQQLGSYKRGFPVGETDAQGRFFLYNHIRIIILTNKDPYAAEEGKTKFRVVGFEVVPTSIKHDYENEPARSSRPRRVASLSTLKKLRWTTTSTSTPPRTRRCCLRTMCSSNRRTFCGRSDGTALSAPSRRMTRSTGSRSSTRS
jgi:transmembrane 9 superfamily protein 2/4